MKQTAASKAVAKRGIPVGAAQGARVPECARLAAQAAIRAAMKRLP